RNKRQRGTKQVGSRQCEPDSEASADGGNEERLPQEQADNPASAGPERQSNTDFSGALRTARVHHVDHVCTGGKQDEGRERQDSERETVCARFDRVEFNRRRRRVGWPLSILSEAFVVASERLQAVRAGQQNIPDPG